MVDKCVMCGEIIPEGRMVCPKCEDAESSLETIRLKVLLNKIKDVSKFVGLVSKCKDDVVIKTGKFAVNAKSIMSLFTLDLSKPVIAEFYGVIPYDIRTELNKFIIDQ